MRMALLGASGCGKSVTLKCIAGIMTPDRGHIILDGETLFGRGDRDMCAVDGCHPTSLGFLRMADRLEPVLRRALADRA